nr:MULTISPECIES: ATP-dependent DNA ligase [unclassified Rhodococcus (in: high G+C Gram-positive bacteria)]
MASVEVDGAVKLFSRNTNDVTASYPETVDALALAAAGRSLLVDGELVALNKSGQPDFGLLQRRMHLARPSAALLRSVPVAYFVFDVLGVDGKSVQHLPYSERRRILDDLALTDGTRVQVPPNMTGVEGSALMEIAAEHGIEGIVAKRADSLYLPGARSKMWVKTPIRNSRDGIVCGFVPTGGRASGPLAALLLGAYDEHGDLVYIGSVGTGFTDRIRRELRQRLTAIARADSPLSVAVPRSDSAGVTWVEPVAVAIVEYREQSASGRLRHPSFKGIRADMDTMQVRV